MQPSTLCNAGDIKPYHDRPKQKTQHPRKLQRHAVVTDDTSGVALMQACMHSGTCAAMHATLYSLRGQHALVVWVHRRQRYFGVRAMRRTGLDFTLHACVRCLKDVIHVAYVAHGAGYEGRSCLSMQLQFSSHIK